jgi:hypothetical protein
MPMIATAKLAPATPPDAPATRRAGRIEFDFSTKDLPIAFEGFSGAEPIGRWTNGPDAKLSLSLPPGDDPVLLVSLDARAFLVPEKWPQQRVTVSVGGAAIATWQFQENQIRRHAIALRRDTLADRSKLPLSLHLPDCAQPVAFGFKADQRFLGILVRRLILEEAPDLPPPEALFWQYGRPVGGEAAKSFDRRIESGFWQRFVKGSKVLDVGFRGYGGSVLPILEGAIGVDLDYPGYDGHRLPFEDGSQDAVFSSHCLEHIPNYVQIIQDWYRVTRVGGHIITVVPSAALYERRRRPPSRWNDDHKRFYSPASLLGEFEQALAPNSYRVRLLEENDELYRYADAPDIHPFGAYEIVLVIEKLAPPPWVLEG